MMRDGDVKGGVAVVAVAKHEFAYRAVRAQSDAFEDLGRRLTKEASAWAADLDEGIRFTVAQLDFVRGIVEHTPEATEGVPPSWADSAQDQADTMFRLIGLDCAILGYGVRRLKELEIGVEGEGELTRARKESRSLRARVVPGLSEDEMDAVGEEEWPPPRARPRMPLGLRLSPRLYKNRLRYETPAVALSAV